MLITFKLNMYNLKLSVNWIILIVVYSFQVRATQDIPSKDIPLNNSEYFNSVKSAVFADAYDELPHYQVKKQLFDEGKRNVLLEDAHRTMQSSNDLIEFPAKQKLLQANGICFAGKWLINSQSPYTGLYSKNTQANILTRVSVSLSGTTQKDKRAMGMAVKLFTESNTAGVLKTLNAFVMHSLGGVKTQYVLELSMDNEPELGALPPFKKLLTAYRLEKDLEQADREYSGEHANARFRPVSHLAKFNVNGNKVPDVYGPHWMKISPVTSNIKVDQQDFRDELHLPHYPKHTLVWDIYGADYQKDGKSDAKWQPIGQLVVNESVRSKSCDTRLHFQHPSIQPSTLSK